MVAPPFEPEGIESGDAVRATAPDGAEIANGVGRGTCRATANCQFIPPISVPHLRSFAVVIMYASLPMSLPNVEDLLFERGVDLCHETVRLWWNKVRAAVRRPGESQSTTLSVH